MVALEVPRHRGVAVGAVAVVEVVAAEVVVEEAILLLMVTIAIVVERDLIKEDGFRFISTGVLRRFQLLAGEVLLSFVPFHESRKKLLKGYFTYFYQEICVTNTDIQGFVYSEEG